MEGVEIKKYINNKTSNTYSEKSRAARNSVLTSSVIEKASTNYEWSWLKNKTK